MQPGRSRVARGAPGWWFAVTMHITRRVSRRYSSLSMLASVGLCSLSLAWLPAIAGGDGVSLSHPTVAGGGGVVEAGQFRVYFTIGEPLAGAASAGEFTVVGGLQATFLGNQQPLPDEGIFSDSFESLD